MARSSRIIIIFVVIALILGIGCLFLIDFSGDAQNLQNAQKNTVTEVENDAPGNKKVEADRWSVIEGRLSIFSDTELLKKSKLVVPAVYEMIEDAFVSCPNLKTVIIPDSVKKIYKYEFMDCKDKVTLYVKKHSYAEKWAKKHKIKYAYGKPKEGA